jgi:hypothetical protein
MIHAAIGDDGKVQEAEAVQTSDPALSQAALDHILHANYSGGSAGANPVQRDAFINVRFEVAQSSL